MDSQLLTGTLEMLILDVLSRGDSYGYQIAQTVVSESNGYFDIKEGSLYPALHRLQRQRLLKAYWVNTDAGRRRKYYQLTAAGKKILREKKKKWQQFSTAVTGVLGARHGLA